CIVPVARIVPQIWGAAGRPPKSRESGSGGHGVAPSSAVASTPCSAASSPPCSAAFFSAPCSNAVLTASPAAAASPPPLLRRLLAVHADTPFLADPLLLRSSSRSPSLRGREEPGRVLPLGATTSNKARPLQRRLAARRC
ncbi:unnamed protein product, partial [Urochloa humidicola]